MLVIPLHLYILATDEALDIVNGARGVAGRLVLCRLADQALCVGKGDVGGGDAVALVVGDDLHASVFVDAHARVGRAKVNANDGAQFLLLALVCCQCSAGDGQRKHCERDGG